MGKIFNIIWQSELDSTQSYLNSMNFENLPDWTVIATKNQTKGRGQGGNQWETQKDKNLTFSILIKPTFLKPSQQFLITQIISLGICDYLKQFTENACIKWPNDIYIGNNKICGILIQNSICGDIFSNSICGIGININQTYFCLAPNPTSLKLETGNDYEIEKELEDILMYIRLRYEMAKNMNILVKEYMSKLLFFNIDKPYYYMGKRIIAKIIDVNEYGHLILITKDNNKIIASMKEIRFELNQ